MVVLFALFIRAEKERGKLTEVYHLRIQSTHDDSLGTGFLAFASVPLIELPNKLSRSDPLRSSESLFLVRRLAGGTASVGSPCAPSPAVAGAVSLDFRLFESLTDFTELAL